MEDMERKGCVWVDGATEEVKGQNELSKNNAKGVNDEQPGCSSVRVEILSVTDSTEKRETRDSVEVVCVCVSTEAVQAVSAY